MILHDVSSVRRGIFALLLLTTLSACSAQPPTSADTPSNASSNTPAASAEAAPAQTPQDWRIAGEFTNRHGFRYVYAIIPAGLSTPELIDRARAIHQQQPDAWLWLLDSDAEIDALLAALPAIEQTPPDALPDMSKFPKAYLEQHTRAQSVLVMHPDRRRTWVLYQGNGRDVELATLPCIDGKGRCRD